MNNFSKHTVKIILPIFLIVVFFFTQGCASFTQRTKFEKSSINNAGEDTSVTDEKPKVQEYTLGEGDGLYISVWQEDDLSQEVIVRPDGKVSFPLAGDVPVLGLTFTQLKDELTKRLKEYI